MSTKASHLISTSHSKSFDKFKESEIQISLKTVLIAEDSEYEIENDFIFKSPYIQNIQSKLKTNEGLRIKLPKWVPKSSLEIILIFLKYEKFPDLTKTSTISIQRSLWLGDFLRLQEFQQQFIQEKLVPNLNKSNCIVFLNESFKKLCNSESCPDAWYALFNSSMNILAKNLVWNFSNKKSELLQINDKIIEETIERALKINKSQFSADQREIVDILLHLRKKNSIFGLLDSQRKIVLDRKLVNNPSHPNNIVWKLSHLNKINAKETNPFKFGGHCWKLLAKTKQDENRDDQFLFYLKFDPQASTQSGIEDSEKTNNSTLLDDILTISFAMKANGSLVHNNVQIRSMNFEKSPLIKLHTLEKQEIDQFSNKDNEFIVHLNFEGVYAAILTHISKNIEKNNTLRSDNLLGKDDLCALLKGLPSSSLSHEHGLILLSSWLSMNPNSCEMEDIFKSIDWRLTPMSSLTKALNSDGFRVSLAARQLLERQISKKIEDSNRSIKDNSFKYFPSEQGKKEVIENDLSREPLRSIPYYSSQGSLQRGRFLNQSHHIVETEQSRYHSLQKEPSSKALSLNTSLRSNAEIANVPRIFQNRTMATETSPSPNKILNSRISLSPKKFYERSFDKQPEYYSKTLVQPDSSEQIPDSLNSIDNNNKIHGIQSPPSSTLSKAQILLGDISSREGKPLTSSLSLTNNKNAFSGSNLPKVGFISPVTSPTHNGNLATSMNFLPAKEGFVSPLQERHTFTSLNNLNNLSSLSSLNTQVKAQDKRMLNHVAMDSNLKSRETSLSKARDSYSSDIGDFKKFNEKNYTHYPSLEEVRDLYSLLTKSAQEKITKIRRALQKEKEMTKAQIFNKINIKSFLVGEHLDIFD